MGLKFQFKGNIYTDPKGNQVLVDFYNFCNQYSNCTIEIDWNGLNYLDANLSALLLAMVYKLRTHNNLRFFLDYKCLKGDLSVFYRNGLMNHIFQNDKKADDGRDSTIPVCKFNSGEVDQFTNYIERDLLKHRGVEQISFSDKTKVKNSYFELFNNYEVHAKTDLPVYACGQFFPFQKELKFTLVDMGVGFLKNIAEFTASTDKITTAVEAIFWAIKGGSTKKDAPGGTGLKKILFYCMKNRGGVHIITDNCHWQYDGSMTNSTVNKPFVGSTLHLIFRG